MRFVLLCLLPCWLVCGVSKASANPSFGDSTWVAPAEMFDTASTAEGIRVAPPDDERGWESALRAPFRVVFYPLRLVARGLEAAAGFVGPRYLAPKKIGPPKRGPSVAPFVGLGDVNDLTVGAGLTWMHFPFDDARLQVDGSWSTFDGRRARISEVIGYRRPVGFRLSYDYRYKPNRRFYGIGNDAPQSDLSYYLLANSDFEAALLLGASPARQLRILGGYSTLDPGSGYHGEPLLADVFPPGSVPFEKQTTQSLWYGVEASYAVVDDTRDPSRGVDARAELRRAWGLHADDPDYDQWRAEVRGYLPVFASRRVIAVRGVYAGIDPRGSTTAELPFYALSESRGTLRFAGYSQGRFRDQQLLLARIEYRWRILHRISAFGLYEMGEVAPSFESFTLRDTHNSYGGGLRFGMSESAVLRLELASGDEGLHAALGFGAGF